MAYDKDSIALIVKEILQQVGQQGTQQNSQQIAEAVQQAVQKVQGSTQEKASSIERMSVSENKNEEINSGEALRAGIVSNTRLWNWNEKLLASKEFDYDAALKTLQIKEKEIDVARKEHNFAISQHLDHLKIIAATNANNFNVGVQFDYAKFNNATSEPLGPDTGSDEKDASK